jgi:predicted GIY-YIG superfamily endonuclease
MASRERGTLYVGVTSDLIRRVAEHRLAEPPSFTGRYDCRTLVWFERYDEMREAITREKQLKAGSRQRKIDLIEAKNLEWRDLYPDILG